MPLTCQKHTLWPLAFGFPFPEDSAVLKSVTMNLWLGGWPYYPKCTWSHLNLWLDHHSPWQLCWLSYLVIALCPQDVADCPGLEVRVANEAFLLDANGVTVSGSHMRPFHILVPYSQQFNYVFDLHPNWCFYFPSCGEDTLRRAILNFSICIIYYSVFKPNVFGSLVPSDVRLGV
jgi:hypothetical protein